MADLDEVGEDSESTVLALLCRSCLNWSGSCLLWLMGVRGVEGFETRIRAGLSRVPDRVQMCGSRQVRKVALCNILMVEILRVSSEWCNGNVNKTKNIMKHELRYGIKHP